MKTTINGFLLIFSIAIIMGLSSCGDDEMTPMGMDPDTAEKQSVDRFSAAAGTLLVRDASNGLPAVNAAINFDQAPFITQGLAPNGSMVEYYNFDVMSTTPAPIYVPMHEGMAISGQLNIVDVIPGDPGYNDFWLVHIVDVPEDYVANTLTSVQDVQTSGYTVTPSAMIVNCPIVPEGSTASKRVGGGATGLIRGWYDGKVVFYFTFEEKALTGPKVPLSPIYVTFNINPDQTGGGPPSGFVTETGNAQTHNVLATVPADPTYSPLWSVNVYDNADFDNVMDITTALNSNILATGVATVNCPVVSQ